MERDGAGRNPTLERCRDIVARVQRDHGEIYDRLIEIGYFSRDEASQQYVPTWSGAYRAAYRLLPPFKQIQQMQRESIANKTLRELGFGSMEGFRRSQRLLLPEPQACLTQVMML